MTRHPIDPTTQDRPFTALNLKLPPVMVAAIDTARARQGLNKTRSAWIRDSIATALEVRG